MPPRDLLGQDLYDAGWRQGSVFIASTLLRLWNGMDADTFVAMSAPLEPDDQLVLITQDCDLVRDRVAEPYVEALVSRVIEPGLARQAEQNSARFFVIEPGTRLAAHAALRVILEKEALLCVSSRTWPWPSPTRHARFVRWLARRYDRAAIPDELVDSFQRPVEKALHELHKRRPDLLQPFSSAVEEVRVSMPTSEVPPHEVHLLLLARAPSLTQVELDAIDAVLAEFENALDRDRIRIAGQDVLSLEEVSMAQYYATRPLFLEYMTYGGEEKSGAEPPSRV